MRRKKHVEEGEPQEAIQEPTVVESPESEPVQEKPKKKRRRKKTVEVEAEPQSSESSETVIEEKPKKKHRRKKSIDGVESVEVHTKEQMTLAMESILKEKFGFKTNSKAVGSFVMINSDCLKELVKSLDHFDGQVHKMPEEIPALKGMNKKGMIETLDLILKSKYHIPLSPKTLKSFIWVQTNELKEFIKMFV